MKRSKFLHNLAAQVATGKSIRQAAQTCGCSVDRAYELSRTIDFRQLVGQLRTEALAQTVGRLSAIATESVDVLSELLKPEQQPSTRLAAAKAVLSSLAPVSEVAELRQRMDELEQQHRQPLKVVNQ